MTDWNTDTQGSWYAVNQRKYPKIARQLLAIMSQDGSGRRPRDLAALLTWSQPLTRAWLSKYRRYGFLLCQSGLYSITAKGRKRLAWLVMNDPEIES